MKPLLVVGSSGHAAAVLDCIEQEAKYRVVGLLDSFAPAGAEKHGYPICGAPEDALRLSRHFDCLQFFIAVGDNGVRQRLSRQIAASVPAAQFASVVHPSALVSRTVSVGDGSIILEGAIVQTDVLLQPGCIVNAAAGLGHDCRIEAFASLSGGVRLAGACVVGERAAVGLGACVIEKIKVGRDAVVSAGAVVFRDVPAETVVLGNPARVVRSRKPDEPYLR